MATLEEVFNSMSDSDYIHDSVQFVIDENLRIISIPKEGLVAGVVGDKNVNRINFKMNRFYNGFDMSTFDVRINYINSLNEPNYYKVKDLTIEDDYILFTWLIDSDVTVDIGNVKFVVKFIKCDESGVIDQLFNTTISSLQVLEGINVDDYISPAAVTDILSRLESDMNTYCDDKKEEILNSIPENYTDLSENVDELDSKLREYKDNVILLKNRVISFVDGKYVTIAGTGDDENYGFVVADVEPNKTYSFTVYGSNNFSYVKDKDGNLVAKMVDCKVATAGHVYTMPEGAKYAYICGDNIHDIQGEVVCLEVDKSIVELGITTENFPYNTVKRVIVDKLFLNFDQSLTDYVTDYVTNYVTDHVTDYVGNYITDYTHVGINPVEKLTNVSELIHWGSDTTVTFVDNVCVVDCISVNNGVVTKKLVSASDSVKIHIKGRVTNTDFILDFLTCYDKNDGSTVWGGNTFPQIVPDTDGSFEFSTIVDFANLAIYEDMKDVFFVFRNFVEESTEGTIYIDTFDVWEMTVLEKQDVYSDNLSETLVNINKKIDNNGISHISEVEFKMISPNGNKSILSVQNDGSLYAIPTIPNKVLFVGNSILWGMGFYGMCASSPRNDYAYLVQQAIIKKNAGAEFSKCHGAQFEQAEDDETAKAYWTTTANTITGKPASESFTNDLDLIIMQVSDNVSNDLREETFLNNLDWLVTQIKANSPKARIIWVDGWFNNKRTYDTITSVCSKWKIPRVNIFDLNITENQGYSGQTYEKSDGTTDVVSNNWITHPGDTGMKLIADRIIEALDM